MRRLILPLLLLSTTSALADAPAQTDPRAVARAAAQAAHIPAPIVSLPPAATTARDKQDGNMLFWTQAQKDARFRAMDTLYPGTLIKAGKRVRPLPVGRPLAIAKSEVDAIMAENRMAGLLVVTEGKVRLERYERGYSRQQRYTSFSMAKSFTATLLGMAIADGKIGSVDDQMTRYLPELKGSAYDGVTIRNALMMMSGVKWDETYENPDADVSKMFRDPPPTGEDSTIAYMRRLPRAVPAGTKWNYSTGESALIGVLVKRAVGMPLAQYLSDKVWKPYGMERDGFWMTDWSFNEMGGCCISAALRDNARFGMFIMDGAMGKLPRDYWQTMARPLVPIGKDVGYGYQWWTFPGDSYGAMGHDGQLIIIHPATRTIIAVNSAMAEAGAKGRRERLDAFFQKLIALTEGGRPAR